jgi:hypothetical protein
VFNYARILLDGLGRYWEQKTRKATGSAGLVDFLGLVNGGDKRDRTADLLHAMQALSQLSYTPEKNAHYK